MKKHKKLTIARLIFVVVLATALFFLTRRFGLRQSALIMVTAKILFGLFIGKITHGRKVSRSYPHARAFNQVLGAVTASFVGFLIYREFGAIVLLWSVFGLIAALFVAARVV